MLPVSPTENSWPASTLSDRLLSFRYVHDRCRTCQRPIRTRPSRGNAVFPSCPQAATPREPPPLLPRLSDTGGVQGARCHRAKAGTCRRSQVQGLGGAATEGCITADGLVDDAPSTTGSAADELPPKIRQGRRRTYMRRQRHRPRAILPNECEALTHIRAGPEIAGPSASRATTTTKCLYQLCLPASGGPR